MDEPDNKTSRREANVTAIQDAHYPMRLVTRLTGLPADTIRAWERRYDAVTPHRSAGNTRRFSADDVRRLTLLREATERGHAIGTIAQLPTDEIGALVHSDLPPSGTPDVAPVDDGFATWREAYLGAICRFEVRRAFALLGRAATLLERRVFVYDVVIPIVQAVGERWSSGELGIAQEHLVSRQLLSIINLTLETGSPGEGASRILLTTPAGHRHEFGVLIAALLATSRGIQPVYLGSDLPLDEIAWAVRMSRAQAVVLSVVRDLDADEADLPERLESLAKWAPLWVGCPAQHALTGAVPSARLFHRYEDFEDALDDL